MANSVNVVKKEIIEQIYEGDQTYDSIKKAAGELIKLSKELRDKGKDVKILVDLTKMGHSTAGSRKASVEALKNTDYDRLAVFGGGAYIRHLANFIIRASGRGKKAKVFATKKEAVKWLKG